MFEKRLYYHVDWAMLGAILALCAIGLFQIYSATGGDGRHVTQMYGIAVGLVALVVCLAIDYRSLTDKSLFIYLAVVGLLIFVLFFGVVRGGSRRWIDVSASQRGSKTASRWSSPSFWATAGAAPSCAVIW